jgi:RNA polymerase sigma-70 factor, ECF subfamily
MLCVLASTLCSGRPGNSVDFQRLDRRHDTVVVVGVSGDGEPGRPASAQRQEPAEPADKPEPPQATTEELLLMVGLGDIDAFETLYDRIAGLVFGTVRRVLRDPAQSEEVAQEVLLEVWRTAARFDPGRARATTWVLTMAHRRAVDRVRSAQAASDRETRSALLDRQTPFDDVSETVQSNLEREEVKRALDELTDVQRQAIQLAYYDGHSQSEVATILDLPLGTVKTRMRDGLIRLRVALGVTQ